MSSPIERFKGWMYHFLFRILPARVFLRLNGIKLPSRKTTVTVTQLFALKEIEIEVAVGDISAVPVMVPLFFKHGMIHNHQGQRRWLPPDKLIKVEWFDPILEEQVEIYNAFRDSEYIDYVLSN